MRRRTRKSSSVRRRQQGYKSPQGQKTSKDKDQEPARALFFVSSCANAPKPPLLRTPELSVADHEHPEQWGVSLQGPATGCSKDCVTSTMSDADHNGVLQAS